MLKGFSLFGVGSTSTPTHLNNCDCCAKGPNIFSLHEAAALRARKRAQLAAARAAAPEAEKGAPHDMEFPEPETPPAPSR